MYCSSYENFGITDKNVHRIKENVNSRNVKSKFNCKYENSTYTSK